ncbi:MAG: GDSL-type esterase/lipase family protein [Burkholderiales bacterium]
MRIAKEVVATVLAVAALAGCGGGGDSDLSPGVGAAPPPLSIVVVGDSIAAGEGINYGYYYEKGYLFNGWAGGTPDPVWQGNYQLCHDSALAYGDVLASTIGATLAKFACTGSTYQNGIAFDRMYGGQLYRPAQFGNWLAQTNLNAAYDAAKPDVVIVTFGADDVSFADIVTFCATGYTSAAEVASVVAHPERSRRIRENFVKRFPTREAWQARPPRASSSSYCTSANPGDAIQNLFWDPVTSGQIAGNYRNLVAAIKARGEKAGKVPKIVFTTYHQPLPLPGQSIDCADLGDLTRDEIDYLVALEQTLQKTLVDAVGNLDGVAIADISGVVAGHQFCSDDPWTYGLSVYLIEGMKDSLAPFHPTPQGQAAIAAVVRKSLP